MPLFRAASAAPASVLFLVYVSAASAATAAYYVSPAVGSDSLHNGTRGEPWASAAAASDRVSAVMVDKLDVSLFLSRDSLFINDPLRLHATSAAAKIHVGAYGNTSLPRPLIQFARGLTDIGAAPCVHIDVPLAVAVIVENLHFSGCARALVIAGATALGQATSNIWITTNVFADIRTPFLRYTPPNPNWAPAILLDGGYFKNVTVTKNTAARIDAFFSSNANVNTLDLNGNTVQQCSGNCYSLGQGIGLTLRNSVMLRDTSTRLFSYGTTDVIIGTISGANALIDNDFNRRGEYTGGPDGCAFDFETSASGFIVKGNTFSQSWGAGLMIFGHETTSHDIQIVDNTFDRCGCVQNRGDRGAVGVMCPNHNKPSGNLSNNVFFTLPECPAINVAFKGCDDGLIQKDNSISEYNQNSPGMVIEPQLSFDPPSPADTATSGMWKIIAVTETKGATIRYTLDGSRPTEESPLIDGVAGIKLPWPGPATNVNVRAFKDGLSPSITNGALVELNYGFGRQAPGAGTAGPGGHSIGDLAGNVDSFVAAEATVRGWAVDSALPKRGWAPVVVVAFVDGEAVSSTVADQSRPDLVSAGVAPNPEHGFSLTIPQSAFSRLQSNGRHVLLVRIVGSPSSVVPRELTEKTRVVCVSGRCTI
eukprot:g1728.t1